MEIKDIAVEVERTEEIRGGSDAIVAQYSHIEGIENVAAISIGGSGPTNLSDSPVSLQNSVGQLNTVTQNGTATSTVDTRTLFTIDRSVFSF